MARIDPKTGKLDFSSYMQNYTAPLPSVTDQQAELKRLMTPATGGAYTNTMQQTGGQSLWDAAVGGVNDLTNNFMSMLNSPASGGQSTTSTQSTVGTTGTNTVGSFPSMTVPMGGGTMATTAAPAAPVVKPVGSVGSTAGTSNNSNNMFTSLIGDIGTTLGIDDWTMEGMGKAAGLGLGVAKLGLANKYLGLAEDTFGLAEQAYYDKKAMASQEYSELQSRRASANS